ncbi:MAG: nucleoside deaminase [Lancefieldella rimae]|uniref:tRNA-specific adenosine deaminase n=1 Tax=Lancefieldella rimae TaxID=1383 RepID=A0A930W2K0_9ACTN|nr:nucleoside deaminase [Lancefieldella rimae]
MDYFTNTESSQDFSADSEKNGEKTIVKIEQNSAARDESGTCDEGAAYGEEIVRDEKYMRLALSEAAAAAAEGEVPIGAVVVCDGEVIASAHNRREVDNSPSAHAEFLAMEEASRVLKRWRLTGCTVYVTLEPCLMCAGLMVNSRIDRCVFGACDPKGGALGTLYDVSCDSRLNHEFQVTSGVLADEAAAQLKAFFRERRQRSSSIGHN